MLNIKAIDFVWKTSYHNCDCCGNYENKEYKLTFLDGKRNTINEISRYSDGHFGYGEYFEFMDVLVIIANTFNVAILERNFYENNWHEEYLTTVKEDARHRIVIEKLEDNSTEYSYTLNGYFFKDNVQVECKDLKVAYLNEYDMEEKFILDCLKNIIPIEFKSSNQDFFRNYDD